MNVVYEACAGLDVHKRTVVGCAIVPDATGQRHKERRTFSTMTPDLVLLRQWLTTLLAGEVDPVVLANLARGRMRSKRELLAQALQGHLKPHHSFLLSEQLADIDALEEAIDHMNTEIAVRVRPHEPQLQRLSTIPGLKRRLAEVLLAEVLLAEIGPD
jgi:transposase